MAASLDLSRRGLVARRAARAWKIVFLAALCVIATATHWPNIHVGDPTRPPDKIIHFIAFGGLAALLWQTGWVKSRVGLVLAGLGIAVVDELTQAIGIQGRQTSVEDVVAGALGVVVVVAGVWAFAPVGGIAAFLRQERRRVAEQFVFARLGPWLSLLSSAVFGIAVMMPVSMLIDSRFPRPNPLQAGLVGAVLGAVLSSLIMLEALVRQTLRATADKPRCTSCGGDALEGASCTHCGEAVDRALFIDWPEVGGMLFLRLAARPLLLGVGIVIAVAAVSMTIGALRLSYVWAARIDELVQGRAYGMTSVLDLTLVGVACTCAIRSFRKRCARRADSASEHCIACAHDLSRTPASTAQSLRRDAAGVSHSCAIGRCGECGAEFVREFSASASGA